MTPSEVDRLFSSWRANGDQQAHVRLVAIYRPLADRLARRHQGGTEAPAPDLEHAAELALLKALDGYDIRRHRGFVAHAVPTILGELRRHSPASAQTSRRTDSNAAATHRTAA